MTTQLAVVLARGLGTRMRRHDPDARLDPDQQAAADAGHKALMPDARGRPLLDHILTSLAAAGMSRVILVVAPLPNPVGEYLQQQTGRRLDVRLAVQAEPHGTADAIASAATAIGDAPFLVLNADNLYPVDAIRQVAALDQPGLAAFDREALVRDSNIPPERLAAFALLRLDAHHHLVDLIEKPDAARAAAFGDTRWLSMNLWRFDHRVLAACRRVPRSIRGEHELPDAVRLAQAEGVAFQAVPIRAGVLDLSTRGDVAAVAAALATREVAW